MPMKSSPQDVLTKRKRVVVSNSYTTSPPYKTNKPASIATLRVIGRMQLITPAVAALHDIGYASTPLGVEPCCSS